MLPACPIELTAEESDHCPCRRREVHQAGRVEVRVIVCKWPRLYNGREVMNPPAFAEMTRKSCHMKVQTEKILARMEIAQKEEREMGKQNGKHVDVVERPPAVEIPDAEVTATTAVVPATKSPLAEVPAFANLPATRVPVEIPATLAGALALAQAKCLPAKKDSRNTHHGYRYASADAVIAEAKAALRDTGLALIPSEVALNRTESGLELFRRFTLVHLSGQEMQLACAWPVEVEKGRPLDKATAIASTTSLAYMLRDLLMIPRVMPDGDMDSRTDAKPAAVSARAAKEAAAQAQPQTAPTPTKITDSQLTRLRDLRDQLFEAQKPVDRAAAWEAIIKKRGVSTAANLTTVQAEELINSIAATLTTMDVEKAMSVGTKGG